jgi:hypothetical protein
VFVFRGQTYCSASQPSVLPETNFVVVELTATHQTGNEVVLEVTQDILILGQAE